jgi:transposase
MPRPYPKEFREGALQLVGRAIARSCRSLTSSGSPSRVCGGGSSRLSETAVRDDGLSTIEREELRRLRRENARLKQEKETSGLNSQPACTPANASLRPHGSPTHDPGPPWLATPST